MAEKPTRENLIKAARKKVEGLLSEIMFIQKHEIKEEFRKGEQPDLVVEFAGKDGLHVMLVEVRANGEPRMAREAVNALLVEMRLWSYAYPLFVAPYISSESAEICRKNRVGYMDLAGNCHICFDSIYIHSEGKTNPFKTKRRLKSLSRPKAGRIIRVLLNHPHREWQTRELAEQSKVSMGLVSNVKKILKDREFIDGKKRKIALTRPWSLLEKWIANAPEESFEPMEFFHVPMNFVQIENMILERCRRRNINCAFTGLSGAVHLVPDIDYHQVQAYIFSDLDAAGFEPGFEKNRTKPNLVLIKTKDEGVFYKARQVMPTSRLQYYRPTDTKIKTIESEIGTGIQIVSPIQIYFDLKKRFRVNEAGAGKVFHHVLEPSW